MNKNLIRFQRTSGILLHPTSLPGPFGIGDFGEFSFQFIDFLQKANQSLWQIYPLGPTGFGDSPYQCFSAFAGNPLFLDPKKLVQEGLLTLEDLETKPVFSKDWVDYGKVITWKNQIHLKAFNQFKKSESNLRALTEFERNQTWVQDYSLFMALKEKFEGKGWFDWPAPLKNRDKEALSHFQKEHKEEIHFQVFCQFKFLEQWRRVKTYANQKGIEIVGDIPIFVAMDSADTWSAPGEFLLDPDGKPKAVAGVPPDYFSKTGQLWGNPLYNWNEMEKRDFSWWVRRMVSAFELYDVVRIDHFRGFAAFWSVPYGESTAVNGKWVKAPGTALFKAIRKALPEAKIIAEDLGHIDKPVRDLKKHFDFPGMKILQFSLDGDPHNEYLPHNYPDSNSVVYTGTHDNETLMGWYQNVPDGKRDYIQKMLQNPKDGVPWGMIRLGMGSVAHTFLLPLQDLLGLGNEARMNTPGEQKGNWGWRLDPNKITAEMIQKLGQLTQLYNRDPKVKPQNSEEFEVPEISES